MNVHDIHAKKDAAIVAGLRAAGATIEPPQSLDATAMAVRAVRNVRRRRVVVAATTALAGLVLAGAGIGAAGAIYADQQVPLPGADKSSEEPSPTSELPAPAPSEALEDAPTEYLETGGGTLPVLPGVERGVVESGEQSPYILGGLWYEVPPGGWSAVGDVNAGGVAGWLDPERPDALSLGADRTIDDMDATIELRNVFDVAGWTAPARDSGATTLDIEGADLVVIEQHEDEGKIRPVTITLRSGDEGWIIETRFTADAAGDTMLRNFVGNLWLRDAGEPDWYQPAFSYPTLAAIEQGVPAGWVRTEHNGLKFAVPPGWTAEETEGEFSPGVEWTGPTITHADPGVDPEWSERVYIQGGLPGNNWWSQNMVAPQSQLIDVPGADYAEVLPTVYNADGEADYYWVDIYLHQEDQGENLFLVVEFDGTEQGLQDLHTFLGTLDFRR
ncbi:hypothetical protein AB1046_16005 [Promicromonospora sp. Populi]|uniref:hypothetical protein n=1 Tax=Promicromonospora sp. Populi TaxID=3239420 RepID=UPI0034E2066E